MEQVESPSLINEHTYFAHESSGPSDEYASASIETGDGRVALYDHVSQACVKTCIVQCAQICFKSFHD